LARLFRIIIPAEDIGPAVRFYRQVLEQEGRRVSPGRHYFDCDLGEIALRPWGELSFYVWDPFGNPLCFVSRDSAFTGSEA
jgi:hypothetical protein